jgi:hypothetical protein
MKFYLYHWVPKGMKGNTLYPLNVLKEKFPELYEQKAKKYEDRMQVMGWRIPTLDCYWNDVIHLIAVHPRVAKQALKDTGYDKEYSVSCYEIDPSSLPPEKTTVCMYTEEPAQGDQFKADEFVPFDVQDMEKYSVIPQRTKDYYKKCIENDRIPLSFPWVPHIFYKGSIDVENLKIVQA